MNRSSMTGIIGFIMVMLVGNVIFGIASSASETLSTGTDGRSLRWNRFDVTLDTMDTVANRFDVAETYELYIETGPYRYGFREIPLDRIEAIDNVAVYDGGTRLQANCSGSQGTFCVTQTNDTFVLNYYFLDSAPSGQTRDIRIEYTVYGALRSYEGGDQLYWAAVPADLPFPVVASRVLVVMPQDTTIDVTASYPDTWSESIEENTVTWLSPDRMDSNEGVEVRVQYPHDPAMKKPSWQAGYDREQSYKENIQPIVSLVLLAITVLFTGGGILLVIVRYMTHGRDPEAITVPEYLTTPPTDEPPGIVGLLLDEKADMKDIMGTLVDLARRGYFVIEQSESGGIVGMFKSMEFTFHRTEKPLNDLKPFEKRLMSGLFPLDRQETKLSQLKEKFYVHIPKIKQEMYKELVRQGHFTRSPETTRQIWIWGGIGAMIIASVLFWLLRDLSVISPLIIVPPIGLGIVGAAGALAGSYMPAKTRKGAQDAALWKAFRQYMRNVEKYTDVEQAAAQFEQYIGYAVVFGVEKDWIRRLSPALEAMPVWYFPTYLGGPWDGGYHRRRTWVGTGRRMSGGGLGDLTFDGPGGLNDMSRSLSEGLNSLSGGLTDMLNTASRTMTSAPKSKSSGRGGGFSGGGGRGGGSGGGRAGFG